MTNNSDNKKTIKDKLKNEEKKMTEDLKKIKDEVKDAEKIFENHPPSLE